MRQISTFLVCGYDKGDGEEENYLCVQYFHIYTEDLELYFWIENAGCPKSTMKNLSESVTFVIIFWSLFNLYFSDAVVLEFLVSSGRQLHVRIALGRTDL